MELQKKDFGSYLKFRKEGISLNPFEEKYGIDLPPVFKSFLTEFDGIVGDVYMDDSGEVLTLTYYEYHCIALGGKNLFFQDFIPIEDIFKYRSNSDTWVEHGVVPISEHSHGGTILLGIRNDNFDMLFFEYERGIVFIEPNIYSFLRNLNFVMEYAGSTKKLYKNWGEDFWRILKEG